MYFKKRKILWIIVSILCMSILCSMVFVGCSNSTENEQQSNANRETIEYKLEKNVQLPINTILDFRGANKNIILDLNGFCLFANGATAIRVVNGVHVTIKDSNPNTTHYLSYDASTKAYTKYSQEKPAGEEATATSHHVDGSFITVRGGLITGANGGINGGAIVVGCISETDENGNTIAYSGPAPVLTMEGGTLAGNVANGYGGAVYLGSNAKFVLNGGAIVGNHSSSYGGGVFAAVQSTVQLSSGTIAYNDAGRAGGGVYLHGKDYLKITTLTIEKSAKIINNQADHGGGIGGIVCNVTMTGGTVQGNKAREGAGFDLYAVEMKMSGGKIAENIAETRGGAILFAATEQKWMYIQDNIIYSGIHSLEITGGEIINNSATEGAAISASRVSVGITQEMLDKINKGNSKTQDDNAVQIAKQEEGRDATSFKVINQQARSFYTFCISVIIGALLVIVVVWVISCFV